MADPEILAALLSEVRACRICAEHLAAGPRPVVQIGLTARVLIIGQAPGAKVHASGIPWEDDSGVRLRDWTGLSPEDFYDPAKVAMLPMGFCYPGSRDGGDLPPRPECAPAWHARLLAHLPPDRLTLLVGGYAQKAYAAALGRLSMTELVRKRGALGPNVIALPHPAWRSTLWMRKNPWFEAEILPPLRAAITARLSGA